ncbi:hypothetical protein [Comamonas testosteroni]|uniref:hypothetical protein n=1 Tax=Comamonas testosteroni TaxID=285 RepID=UPI0028E42CBB|nr:hypothetical protein [Comamonas testosteroni]
MTTHVIEFSPFGWKMTPEGKFRGAQQLYLRGKQFWVAAVLIDDKYYGDGYVVRHLMCQAIELVLKSLLLIQDYDKYDPMLRKNFGHDLLELSKETCSIYGIAMRAPLEMELNRLNGFFKKHHFRYAYKVEPIFFPANTFPIEHVRRRMRTMLRLADKLFSRNE